jgi:transposase
MYKVQLRGCLKRVGFDKLWGVERSNAWMARFRRLVRHCERLPETLNGLHCAAFALVMLANFVHLTAYSL